MWPWVPICPPMVSKASMRSVRAATLALIAAGGAVAAQDAGPAPAGRAPSGTVRLDASQDWLFALNGYTFTRLLRLERDGTFEEYSREHMFVAISDAGRWRQSDTGELLRCSHYRFNRIRAGELSVWIHGDDVDGLPALATDLERRLDARPSKDTFRAADLKPVPFRWMGASDAFERAPREKGPIVESWKKTASRADLQALIAAIRLRLTNHDGTLEIQSVGRVDGLTWLAQQGDAVEARLLEEYREHRDGAFVSAVAPVSVDGATFAALLGTRQGFMFYTEMNQRIPREAELDDMRPARIAAPQCGSHEDLARPLPPDRE